MQLLTIHFLIVTVFVKLQQSTLLNVCEFHDHPGYGISIEKKIKTTGLAESFFEDVSKFKMPCTNIS